MNTDLAEAVKEAEEALARWDAVPLTANERGSALANCVIALRSLLAATPEPAAILHCPHCDAAVLPTDAPEPATALPEEVRLRGEIYKEAREKADDCGCREWPCSHQMDLKLAAGLLCDEVLAALAARGGRP